MARKKSTEKTGEAPQEDLGPGIVPEDGVIIFMTADERDILAFGADQLATTPGYTSGNPLFHRRVNVMRALVAKYDEASPPPPSKEASDDGGDSR